jgi:hypothetical protein
MIVKYELYDGNLKPQNISLGKQSLIANSLHLESAPHKNSVSEILPVDQHKSFGEKEGSKTSARQQSNRSKAGAFNDSAGAIGFIVPKSEVQSIAKSGSSPRTNMSENTKLMKQVEKLKELKQEAMSKLQGLDQFQCMLVSKTKLSNELSEEEMIKLVTK